MRYVIAVLFIGLAFTPVTAEETGLEELLLRMLRPPSQPAEGEVFTHVLPAALAGEVPELPETALVGGVRWESGAFTALFDVKGALPEAMSAVQDWFIEHGWHLTSASPVGEADHQHAVFCREAMGLVVQGTCGDPDELRLMMEPHSSYCEATPRPDVDVLTELLDALDEGVPDVGRVSMRSRLEHNALHRTERVHSRDGVGALLDGYAGLLEGEGWEEIGRAVQDEVAWSVFRLAHDDNVWLATVTVSGPPGGEPPYGVRFVTIAAHLGPWADLR